MHTQNIYIRYDKFGSDATAQYWITLAKPMTVGEFITEWLTTGDWGYFGICKPGAIFGDPQCEYKWGKIIGKGLPEEYLNKPIKNVHGSGGWSRSDFQFEVDAPTSQNQLRPCPLCGSEEIEVAEVNNPLAFWDSALRGEYSHAVFCYECGLYIKDGYRDKAIKKWNDLPRNELDIPNS